MLTNAGRTVEGMGELGEQAFYVCAQRGREEGALVHVLSPSAPRASSRGRRASSRTPPLRAASNALIT